MGRCGAVLFVLWLSTMHLAGIFLFSKGFMLTRLSLSQTATCSADGAILIGSDSVTLPATAGCRVQKPYDRVILLVVDALRFDFVAHDASAAALANATGAPLPHYLNKMPLVRQMLDGQGNDTRVAHAKLFRFVADAPTTTMQRIKALMTGSLPTFIDAGSNFAATTVLEDNILAQLGGRAVFVGDDTWAEMFPSSFIRTHPYPSFNVRDLDTVDAGVERHIFPEMSAIGEWDLAVAHMLGVDHCGHRHGPNHPAMSRKLAQVDSLINRISIAMGDRDILLVLGDHGMTRDGDHGGDSRGEVDAALIAVSKRPFARVPQAFLDAIAASEDADALGVTVEESGASVSDNSRAIVRAIAQIDLVPTLAALLGVPIPFGNIGAAVVPELTGLSVNRRDNDAMAADAVGGGGRSGDDDADESVLRAVDWLGINAMQVAAYSKAYAVASNNGNSNNGNNGIDADVHASDLSSAREFHAAAANSAPGSEQRMRLACDAASAYVRFLRGNRRNFVSMWARFDVAAMVAGLVVLCLSVVCAGASASWLKVVGMDLPSRGHVVRGIALGAVVAAVAQGALMSLDTDALLSNGFKYSEFLGGFFLFGSFFCPLFSAIAPVAQSLWSSTASGGVGIARVLRALSIHAPSISSPLASFACACVAIRAVGFLSNSFVVGDDAVVHFVAVSVIIAHVVLLVASAASDPSGANGAVAKTLRPRLRTIMLLFFALAVCMRMLMTFGLCREEQSKCYAGGNRASNATNTKDPSATAGIDASSPASVTTGALFGDLWVHAAIAAAVVFACRWRMSVHGNTGGVFGRYADFFPWLSGGVLLTYWVHAGLPVAGGTPAWVSIVYPRTMYAMSLVGGALIFAFPVTVREESQPKEAATGAAAATSPRDQRGRAVVHGLRTVFSSVVVGTIGLLLPVVVMLMGRGRIFPTALACVCAALLCRLASELGEVEFYAASHRRIRQLTSALSTQSDTATPDAKTATLDGAAALSDKTAKAQGATASGRAPSINNSKVAPQSRGKGRRRDGEPTTQTTHDPHVSASPSAAAAAGSADESNSESNEDSAVALPVEAFDVDRRQGTTASLVVAWSFVAACVFYATGHQPALASIRWGAAFEGFTGSDGARIAPAILVLFDTFWPQLLFAIASPLLALAAESTIGEANPSDGEGEYRLRRERAEGRDGPFWAAAVRAPIIMSACNAVWVVGSACAGFVHRRHLMVWKIFAPNFVFSALGLIAVDVGAVVVVLLLERCDGALLRWAASIAGRLGQTPTVAPAVAATHPAQR